MLKPVRMKRLDAVILEEKREDILRELKERGVIQLIDIKETPLYKSLNLSAGKSSWVKVNSSELLSKIDGILEVFNLVRERKDQSIVSQFLGEQVNKKKVEEVPVEKLFDEIEDKIYFLEEKVNRISSELEKLKKEKEEWENAKDVLSKLEKLGVGPRDLKGFKTMLAVFGVIPTKEIEKLDENIKEITDLFAYQSVELDKKNSLILVIYPRKFEVDIGRALRLRRFEEISIPFNISLLDLNSAKEKADSELASIKKEEENLYKELKKLSDAEYGNLLLMKETLQIEKFMDEANTFFGRTSRTYLLRGWVPLHLVNEAREIIERASDGYSVVWISDPEEDEEPPTLLKNPKPTESLELITMTYGAPNYHEIDPTSVIALTFPLIFGLMFGDVGQGLILMALGYYLGVRLETPNIQVKRLGRTIILCGFFSIIAGAIYGSVFGLEGVIHPLWKSPLHHIPEAIKFSLRVGIGILILSCILNMANEIMHKKYADAFVGPYGVAGIWLLLGGTILVTKHGTDIFSLIDDPLIFPLLALPLLVMVIGEWRVTKISLVWSLFETYENLFRYLVNSISFIRIVILAIIHEALSSMMVLVMDSMPPTIVGFAGKAFVFVLGNLFILGIEMFVSFIQTLRLHYYEIFSKFYSGEGKSFNPFKAIRRYTYIEQKL